VSKAISEERSRNYFHQVKGSVVYKGLAVSCSFLAIPLMIHYLGSERFGVWSTLLSLMLWVTFFDLGLGNGLRNKVAESLAKGQLQDAQEYISSAYSLIGIISFILIVVLGIVTFSVSWQKVFNTELLSESILKYTVLITGLFIVINFWLGLVNSVLNAVQKTSIVVLGQFLFNALSLLLIFIIAKTTEASLLYLAIVVGFSMAGANLLLSIWFYNGNRNLMPIITFDLKHAKPLMNLGVQFFAIQLAVLVIYATSKILIAQLFGPEFVTEYEVVFKLFSIITIIYGLVTAPLWSTYSDAFHREDFDWIKKTLKKQIAIFGIIFLSVIVLVVLAKPLIALWIGNEIEVSSILVISMGLFTLVAAWTNIFASFLNGVGKIRVSLIVSVAAMFLNIPVCILLAKYTSLDASAVVIGTIVALMPGVIIGPYQTYKILSLKDVGIWGR